MLDQIHLPQNRRLVGPFVREQRVERGALLLDVGLHILEPLTVPGQDVLELVDLVIGEAELVADLVPPPELRVVRPAPAGPALVP